MFDIVENKGLALGKRGRILHPCRQEDRRARMYKRPCVSLDRLEIRLAVRDIPVHRSERRDRLLHVQSVLERDAE